MKDDVLKASKIVIFEQRYCVWEGESKEKSMKDHLSNGKKKDIMGKEWKIRSQNKREIHWVDKWEYFCLMSGFWEMLNEDI